jgi:acyl-coenzyme A synthetase/AMP-(fatty) acid ligase
VWFVSELPKNPMGKVERGRLKAEAVERIQAAS